LENLELINSTSQNLSCLDSSWRSFYKNVIFDNSGDRNIDVNNNIDGGALVNCEFTNGSFGGILDAQTTNFAYCKVINHGGVGVDWASSTVVMLHCIVHNCTGDGIQAPAAACYIIGCTIDGNAGDGIQAPAQGSVIVNNRITNNTGYGINSTTNDNLEMNNYYWNNTLGDTLNIYAGGFSRLSATNTEAGYTDGSSDDFTLTNGNDGVNVAIPIGALSEATNIGYFTQGMQPAPAAGGGGGGMIVHPGMDGGMRG
jgi:hypothetical protein